MHLFRMKVQAEGKHQLSEYLENHYIRLGREQQPAMHMIFAHVIQDGDYILVGDGERTYLGDLGDYYYVEECDTEEEDSGHRRGVTWLQHVEVNNVHPELMTFLEQDGELGQFHRPLSREQLDQLLVKPAAAAAAGSWVDAETISEAVAILREAMQSGDSERRERAAIALLQAAAHLHRPASLE
ncbi:hypothetical protein [Paenibacillus albus]|uniref:Uncharacterized protein n=1 Tax=Paenibacillus albus TaxID=2495582 RepID=A0A3Q8X2N4_9BACL|nr:hypothetical protein [Paenibacillus albus]AZN39048.1 hypothetical protein EJC50_04725 [Paenibacillus albus]